MFVSSFTYSKMQGQYLIKHFITKVQDALQHVASAAAHRDESQIPWYVKNISGILHSQRYSDRSEVRNLTGVAQQEPPLSVVKLCSDSCKVWGSRKVQVIWLYFHLLMGLGAICSLWVFSISVSDILFRSTSPAWVRQPCVETLSAVGLKTLSTSVRIL